MVELPEEFLTRMRNVLGGGFDDFYDSYKLPPERAVRVNTLKISVEEFKKIFPIPLGESVEWERSAFYTPAEGLGKTVLHSAGAYYVQEPSAMCAVPELEIRGGERVLDLCAAPGGKTTQIAAYMRGNGLLFANEIDYSRCAALKSNIERAGVKNAVVLNRSPQELARSFGEYFDKILVDAPCSGEGMFKKEPNAIPEWSVQNVARCAERQAHILDCADKMLRGGGRLVYSTCTFSPEEDERQIENFLRAHGRFTLIGMKKLYPHEIRGEGHFCAVLQKTGESENEIKSGAAVKRKSDGLTLKIYREWESETLLKPLAAVEAYGDALFLSVGELPDLSRVLPDGGSRAGIFLGRISTDKKRFEPSHRLAMCLKRDEVRSIEVDEATALKFLGGQTFDCSGAEKGWRAVTFSGLPLGWCKATAGTAKNHLPKGIRINQ